MIAAIYIKELRARAICLAGLPIMGLAMWAGLWEVQHAQGIGYNQPELTLQIPFQLGCFASCAIVGVVLGVWSVITEIQPGSWAFLRHRTASARSLFFGKLAAALTLYTAIAGSPLLLGIWWAATHLPGPWIWSMALPPLADFISGTLFIPAGMLIAAREARWFGSRLLPAGCALLFAGATWLPWFWLGALAIAVGWLIILPAAMSAFATRSIESTQRWPARFAISLTLLPALIGIPAAVGGFIGEQFRPAFGGQYQQSYTVMSGSVYHTSSYRGHTVTQEIVGANGQRLDSVPQQDWMQLFTAAQFGSTASLTLNWKESGYGLYHRSPRETSYYFTSIRLNDHEWWYYVYDWGCYVGYAKREGEPATCLGYLGANGLQQDRSQVQPLHLEREWSMPSGDLPTPIEPGRVLNLDLWSRTISTDLAVVPGERVQSAVVLAGRLPDQRSIPGIKIAATDKALYAYDTLDHINLRVPHPEGYPLADISVCPDASSYMIVYHRSAKLEDRAKPLLVVCVDSSGRELARLELPALPQPSYDSGPVTPVIQGIAIPQAIAFLGIIETIRTGRPDITAITSLCSAILCAIVAGLVLRPYAVRLPWRIFWLVIVFALGIDGLLLMLCMRCWPPHVTCPSCHSRRLATRERCEQCGVRFPLPDPGSIGIFDQAETSAQTA